MPAIRLEGVPAPAGASAGTPARPSTVTPVAGLTGAGLPGDMGNMNVAQLQAMSVGAMNTPGAAAVQAALGSHAAVAQAATRAAVGGPGDVNGFRAAMGNVTYLPRDNTRNTINASLGSQFTNPGNSPNSIQPNSVLWFLRDISQSDQKIASSVAGPPGSRPSFIPPGAAAPPPAWVPPGAFNPWTAVPGGPVPRIPRPPGGWGRGGGGGGGGGGPGAPGAPGGGGGGGGPGGGGPGGGGQYPSFNWSGGGSGLLGAGTGAAAGAAAKYTPILAMMFPEVAPLIIAAGAAVQAAHVALTIPQRIARLESQDMAASRPYMDIKTEAYSAGRAAGFSGDTGLESMFPGGYKTPEWMSATGTGPQDAMGLRRRFGVAPRSAEDFEGVTRGLASIGFLPGLSGVEGAAQRSVGQAARYGLVQPNEASIRDYGTQLSETLENAVARGMDRATILQSIDSSVAMAAKGGGLGVDSKSLQDFMFRFTDLPGGKTGEAGLQAQAGLAAANETVGSNPMRTIAYSEAARNIKTPADLRKMLGAEQYEKVMSTPEGKAAANYFFQSQNENNSYAAMRWLGVLTQGNPKAEFNILSNPKLFAGLPAVMQPFGAANVTGMTPAQVLAAQQNPNGLDPLALRASPDAAQGGQQVYYSNQISDSDYRLGLVRMGVRPDLIDTVMEQAKKRNVSPLLIGSVMMQESTGGNSQKMGAYGMPANQNVMQIDPSSGMPKPADAKDSIREGAAHLAADINNSNGDLTGTLKGYNGPRMKPEYAANVMRNMIVGGATVGAVPTDVNQDRASADQAIMAGSVTAFREMDAVLPIVNKDLALFASALERLISIMKSGNTLPPPFLN